MSRRRSTRRVPHDGLCSYCDRAFGTLVSYRGRSVPLRLEFDHLVPWASERVGVNFKDNIIPSCQICNRIKGSLIFGTFAEAKLHVVNELLRRGVQTLVPGEPRVRAGRVCARPDCSATFISGHPDALYCSAKCRYRAWAESNPRKGAEERKRVAALRKESPEEWQARKARQLVERQERSGSLYVQMADQRRLAAEAVAKTHQERQAPHRRRVWELYKQFRIDRGLPVPKRARFNTRYGRGRSESWTWPPE